MKSSRFIVLFLGLCFFHNDLLAQYASKRIKSKYEAYTDSLKQVEYNYTFPILGQGVYKKGFDIPYPVGVMANYMWIQQEVVLDNLKLGLETDNVEVGLTPVDFIEFGRNVNAASTVNVRPDIWILPFLKCLWGFWHQSIIGSYFDFYSFIHLICTTEDLWVILSM
ncbi:hypothetical protein [Algoriphagus sp. NG3]|uniref:hypothetical protein n=1 Tax=unclassified Algoriphagus TaxID=2641541 RepID=UPI002A82D0D4|nr:hypothetical protein [Algoriphagus sp. NG3]WPR75283.1 hypothetical protein SLW71_21710 [Algoriphagus sp. NG3]